MTRNGLVVTAICAAMLAGCVQHYSSTPETRWNVRAVPAPSPSLGPSPNPSPDRPRLPSRAKRGPHGTMRTTGAPGVALTFDDGPHPVWTPKILTRLREAGVKATFCVVGTEVRRYPRLIQQMVLEGHSLCNHSWNHDFGLGSRSKARIKKDLERTNAAIHRAVPGVPIRYYRQPGGQWTTRVVRVARKLGMLSLHWSVDPQDWRRPATTRLARSVIKHTHKGSVVLLHDGGGDRRRTYRALQRILPNLNRRFDLIDL